MEDNELHYSDLKKEADDKGPENKKSVFLSKRFLWTAAAVIIIGFLVFKGAMNIKDKLFKPKKPAAAEAEEVGKEAPVKVYKIKRMDFKDTLPVLGTIKGYKEVPLKFQLSGILESFNFEEGEKIQEGDIIANLEQKEQLLKLKYSELEYDNAKKMFDAGGITQSAVEKARLEYESAKNELEKTNIYAFSDGLLASQDMDVGCMVSPNDKVGMFVDTTRVYADFEIIEKDVPKIKLGQKAEIFIDSLPNTNFMGTVDIISPIIEGRTRTQNVKVEIKNPEGKIKAGMFSRGLISTYEKKNAVIIPASSLKKKEEQGYVVFVVHKDEEKSAPAQEDSPAKGKKDKKAKKKEAPAPAEEPKNLGAVEMRPVQVSYMTQDKVEIEKGLDEGELVVMELYQELQDKERVDIAEVQEILY